MKKVFTLILFLIELNFVFAQSNFAKLITMPQPDSYTIITKANVNNEILVLGLNPYGGGGDNYSYLLDSTGNIKWSHKYIWSGQTTANEYRDFTFTDDKGFIMTQGTFDQNLKSKIFIVRFDSLGNVLWGKRFDNWRRAYGVSILNKPNGRFAICAGTTLPLNQGKKGSVNFLVIDSAGNAINSKRIGNDSIDFIPERMKSIGNGYVIEGQCIYHWAYPYHSFLMRLDANGHVLKTIILDAPYNSTGTTGLTVTHDKKILFVFRIAIINQPYALIKLDEDLNIIWRNTFSPSTFSFENISELPDSTYCLFGGWFGDPHGIKLDTAGNLISGFIINYPGNNYAGRQMVCYGNNLFFHSSSQYLGDMLISSDLNFNAPCYFLPVPFFSASPFAVSDSLVIMNNISNYFPTSIDTFSVIDTTLGYTLTDLCPPLEINENVFNKYISIFPNPTNDFITIHYNLSSPNQTTLSLFTLYGQKLKTILNGKQPAGEHEMKIDLKNVDAGIYFVKLNAEGKEEVRKVVKY